MSKINNTSAYPTVTVASGDLFVMTDVSDVDSTKTTTVDSIASYTIDGAFNGTDTYIPVFDGTDSLINSSLKQNSAASPTLLTVGTGVTFAVTSNATVGGTLGVTGISTFTGSTAHNGGLSSTTGDFSGAVGVDGNFDVGTDKFSVNATTGNATVGNDINIGANTFIGGDIEVNTDKFTVVGLTGNTNISGTLDAAGLASLDGGIDVDGAFTVANTTGAIETSAAAALTATADAAEIKLGNDSALSPQTIRFQGTAGDTVFTGGYNEQSDREYERFSIGWSEEAGGAINGTWISGSREETYEQDTLNIGSTVLDYLYLKVQ